MLKLVRDSSRLITPAHVIVVGNEKGGSGKTTTSVHIAMALLKNGFKVGTIDLDSRQQSLNRYFENRDDYIKRTDVHLDSPEHYFIPRAIGKETVFEIEQDEHQRFMTKLNHLKQTHDFVVVDTPGSSTFLSRLAHSYADTIITPINDSFIDFDVLARIDNNTGEILRPSIYSEMVWNQRMVRAQREGNAKATDWIVMCNRLSHLDAKNKRSVIIALEKLSARVGFRVVPGFTERVIYRELFMNGLTLLDIMDQDLGIKVTLSHVAARVELRDLLSNLKIMKVAEKLGEENFEAAEGVIIAV
jgi:chromosome partitioning protein